MGKTNHLKLIGFTTVCEMVVDNTSVVVQAAPHLVIMGTVCKMVVDMVLDNASTVHVVLADKTCNSMVTVGHVKIINTHTCCVITHEHSVPHHGQNSPYHFRARYGSGCGLNALKYSEGHTLRCPSASVRCTIVLLVIVWAVDFVL